MISKTLTVAGEGLRSKPSAVLVQAACKYPCLITIEYMEKQINAKSMMGVFSLGVCPGESITVSADGEKEAEAIAELELLITSGLKEKE